MSSQATIDSLLFPIEVIFFVLILALIRDWLVCSLSYHSLVDAQSRPWIFSDVESRKWSMLGIVEFAVENYPVLTCVSILQRD